jgi:hypothetical protein
VEWNTRKQEYLERQKGLNRLKFDYGAASTTGITSKPQHHSIQRNTRAQEVPQDSSVARSQLKKEKDVPPHMASQKTLQNSIPVTKDLSYPVNCLVFVKNLYPQTNKTALKALFGDYLMLAMQSQNKPVINGGVDYVDWSKGMSSVGHHLSRKYL